MLIERYEILLEIESEQDPLWKSPARGALMHGLLMNNVSADSLHVGGSTPRPYTQYLKPLEYRKYLWIINTLERSQASPILNWLENLPNELHLEHYDTILRVVETNLVRSVSYSDFMQQLLAELPPKFVGLEFVTPLAFKRAAQQNYSPWPEPRLIAQSALNRWNAFGSAAKFDDPAVLDDVASMVQPGSFALETRHVAMDGTNLSGTIGRVSFHIRNVAPVRQVFSLSCAYAEYCGLGVKTAMGLGAVMYHPNQVSAQSGTAGLRKHNHVFTRNIA